MIPSRLAVAVCHTAPGPLLTQPGPGACMRALFSLDDQSAVARMLFAMKSKRACLVDVSL